MRTAGLGFVVVGMILGACSGSPLGPVLEIEQAATAGPARSGDLVGTGSLRRPAHVVFDVLLPTGAEPGGVLAGAQAEVDAAVAAGQPIVPTGTTLTLLARADRPWDSQGARIIAKAFSPEELPKIAEGPGRIRIAVEVPHEAATRAIRDLATLAHHLAERAGGWVHNPSSDALYTPDVLAARLPKLAQGDIFELIVIHQVVGDGELSLLDTMGLSQLGVPELLVRDVPPGVADHFGNLLNLTATTLVAAGDVTNPGILVVDVSQLSAERRAEWWADALAGATGRFTWRARWSVPEHGADDPGVDAPLSIELDVDDPSLDRGPAMLAALDAFAGAAEDTPVIRSADDPELAAAAQRARTELARMLLPLAKGVTPGASLSIKASFTSADERVEWMWVDVLSARGTRFDGVLANEPSFATQYKIGQRVQIDLADVADYIAIDLAGDRTGGYSIPILKRGSPQ